MCSNSALRPKKMWGGGGRRTPRLRQSHLSINASVKHPLISPCLQEDTKFGIQNIVYPITYGFSKTIFYELKFFFVMTFDDGTNGIFKVLLTGATSVK